MVDIVTNASCTLIDNISANASTATLHDTRMLGAKARYICTERMSEFAREMSWPDCTRS